MSQQEPQNPNQYNPATSAGNPYISTDDSSTFVKLPLGVFNPPNSMNTQQSSSRSPIPPPPPNWQLQTTARPQSKRRYLIVITILVLMVLSLSILEVFQLIKGNSQQFTSNGFGGSTQSMTVSPQKTSVPTATLTPGTITKNLLLKCGDCYDPVLTTISTITIDTTNMRMIWVIKLYNHSGAEQSDFFGDFTLHDPSGNKYPGTGELDNNYYLNSGETAQKQEIFAFLPHPGEIYTLTAKLGASSIVFDPEQFKF